MVHPDMGIVLFWVRDNGHMRGGGSGGNMGVILVQEYDAGISEG